MSVDSATVSRSAENASLEAPNLKEYLLKATAGKRAYYVPNQGNAGDSLISLGSLDFLNESGIDYSLSVRPESLKDSVVIYGGGASIAGGLYSRIEQLVLQLLKNGNRLIVLPHTVRKLSTEMCSYGKALTIFAREETTYRYLCSLNALAYVGRADDMAFSINGSREDLSKNSVPLLLLKGLFSSANFKQRGRMIKNLPRALEGQRKCLQFARESREYLNCFRTDIERASKTVPERNVDVSREFMLGSDSKGAIILSSKLLLSTLDRFDEIRTDRLHCCIAGVLLGKRVKFYGNSYYKNESVYRFSIQSRYPNVEWIGSNQPTAE